jgi:hypothetical protein
MEVEGWVAQLKEENWSAATLMRQLRAGEFKGERMNRRPYSKVGDDECRTYARRFSRHTPPTERRRAIAALKEVISFLEQPSSSDEHTTNEQHRVPQCLGTTGRPEEVRDRAKRTRRDKRRRANST